MKRIVVSALVGAALAGCEHSATGNKTTLPGVPAPTPALVSGFEDQPYVALGFDPTSMEFAPDGRLFVAEQQGRLHVIKNGALLPTPFVSLAVEPTSEPGLLGGRLDRAGHQPRT